MTGPRFGAPGLALGVTERLRRFFALNPFEELSVDDIMVKFDCAFGTARNAVEVMCQDGLLERVSVYRLTPGAAARLSGSLPRCALAPPEKTASAAPGPHSAPAGEPPSSHPTSASASPACRPEPPTP